MFIQSMRNCQKGIYYLLCMNKGSQESCRPGNTLLHLLVVPVLFCNLHSPGELLNVHLTQNTPDSTAGSTKSISSTNTCWSLQTWLWNECLQYLLPLVRVFIRQHLAHGQDSLFQYTWPLSLPPHKMEAFDHTNLLLFHAVWPSCSRWLSGNTR